MVAFYFISLQLFSKKIFQIAILSVFFFFADDSKKHNFKSVVDYLKHKQSELYAKAVVEAMEEGEGDLTQCNILLHGPPGAGKTSVKQLMLGLPPLCRERQGSTDILENTVRAVSIKQMKQFRVIDNDELITMLAEEVNSHKTEKEDEQNSKDRAVQNGVAPLQTPYTTTNKPSAAACKANVSVSNADSNEVGTFCFKKAKSIQCIRERLSRQSGSIKLLDSCWHHVVDSGGQPQFQDILPLVYRIPCLSIVTIRLTDEVDMKPRVCFHEEGKNIYKLPDHLLVSNRELIIQTCQMAVSQAASMGIASYVMIVGTHKDKLGEHSEARIRKWNQEIAGIRKEFGKVLILKSEEESIFSVNAMADGPERQEYTKELQECIIATTKESASPVKIPLRWFAYQLDLDNDKGVVRMLDCYKSGKALGMAADDVQNALRFFSKSAMIHYFPEDIPDLVLTKIDPLIGRLSKLVKASFIPPCYCPAEESDRLRAKGCFHKSFLAKVFCDIKTQELQNEEFLKLLVCLKIAVHIGGGEYFLPSALSLEPNPDKTLFQMHSVPLVFSWGEHILPHGFFFTVVIELISRPSNEMDYAFELRTDIPQWRGELQVCEKDGKIPGVVKLINRTRWIQVCSSSKNVQHCPTIYKAVYAAIQKAVKRFEHTGIGSPKVTILCPLCESKDHYCLLTADGKEFTCSTNKSKNGMVTPDMTCWTQGQLTD